MLQIRCPYCGVRDATEFTYHGAANLHRPNAKMKGEELTQVFYDYVYLRDNPRGEHEELWHHTGGCRAYVKVRRNTQTHEIKGTAWPHESIKSEVKS